jgi:hypothetical protein
MKMRRIWVLALELVSIDALQNFLRNYDYYWLSGNLKHFSLNFEQSTSGGVYQLLAYFLNY